jgi:putative heme-binding domain-containing protein
MMLFKQEYGLLVLVAAPVVVCLGLGVSAARGRAADPPGQVTEAVRKHRERQWQFALHNDGSAAQGKKFFFDDNGPDCASCHKVRGEGGTFGPDLSDLADRYDREEIIRSVLRPSDRIADGYQRVTITTTDGRTVGGRLVADTPNYVEVRVHGKVVRFERDLIDECRPDPRSEMPEGLVDDLSEAQFADLVSYLLTLKKTGPVS